MTILKAKIAIYSLKATQIATLECGEVSIKVHAKYSNYIDDLFFSSSNRIIYKYKY